MEKQGEDAACCQQPIVDAVVLCKNIQGEDSLLLRFGRGTGAQQLDEKGDGPDADDWGYTHELAVLLGTRLMVWRRAKVFLR